MAGTDREVTAPFTAQVRHFVKALATDRCPKIRRRAFKLALETFDHDDTSAHDELSAAAIPVLVVCLQRAQRKGDWEEVDSFCQLLCMCFRCSVEKAAEAFRNVGCCLLQNIFYCLNTPCRSISNESLLVLLGKLSTIRVSLFTTEENSKKVVHLLQQIIRGDSNCFNSFTKIGAMRMLAGLAQHEDNKVMLMHVPSLVDDVLAYSGRGDHDSKHQVSTLFCNLSGNTVNQVELLRKKEFVAFLLKLNESVCFETRLNIMTTFRHLSSVFCNKVTLAKNRAVVKALLVASQLEGLRYEAVGTLNRLIGQVTARKMMNFPGLLETILSVALSREENCLTGTIAAQSMKKLAAYISVSHKKHHDLIEALVQIASSNDSTIRLWAARSFIEQSRLPANSFYLVRVPEALNAVLNLANDHDQSVATVAIEVLMSISSHSANVKKIMACNDVVKTLVEKVDQEKSSEAGSYAVQALLALVGQEPQERMAKEYGLVTCLSRFGTSNHADVELKQAALHGVIVLAPLL